MSNSKGPWRTNEHGSIVCYPEGFSIGVLSKQLPEAELKANHNLIVSSPDILEALEQLVAWKEVVTLMAPELGGLLKSMYFAEHVISKAKGE